MAESVERFKMGYEIYSEPESIVRKFLRDKVGRVDVVVVVVPKNDFKFFRREFERQWVTMVMSNDKGIENKWRARLMEYFIKLPPPLRAGYQAASLKRQVARNAKLFREYRGYSVKMTESETEFKVSARAFRDLISGDISPEKFKRIIGESDEGPKMSCLINLGYAIKGVRLIESELDHDDDYLVISFKKDPAVGPLE